MLEKSCELQNFSHLFRYFCLVSLPAWLASLENIIFKAITSRTGLRELKYCSHTYVPLLKGAKKIKFMTETKSCLNIFSFIFIFCSGHVEYEKMRMDQVEKLNECLLISTQCFSCYVCICTYVCVYLLLGKYGESVLVTLTELFSFPYKLKILKLPLKLKFSTIKATIITTQLKNNYLVKY
jgi:hypothetical protein